MDFSFHCNRQFSVLFFLFIYFVLVFKESSLKISLCTQLINKSIFVHNLLSYWRGHCGCTLNIIFNRNRSEKKLDQIAFGMIIVGHEILEKCPQVKINVEYWFPVLCLLVYLKESEYYWVICGIKLAPFWIAYWWQNEMISFVDY